MISNSLIVITIIVAFFGGLVYFMFFRRNNPTYSSYTPQVDNVEKLLILTYINLKPQLTLEEISENLELPLDKVKYYSERFDLVEKNTTNEPYKLTEKPVESNNSIQIYLKDVKNRYIK